MDAVFIYARNLAAMRAFYVETIGLNVLYENDRFVMLQVGKGAKVALHTGRKDEGTGSSHWFMEFIVSDLDAVVRDLLACGVSVDPVSTASYGRTTFFADPEGNRIGLQWGRCANAVRVSRHRDREDRTMVIAKIGAS